MVVVVRNIEGNYEELVYNNVNDIVELTYEECLLEGADLSECSEDDTFFRLILKNGQATFDNTNWKYMIV